MSDRNTDRSPPAMTSQSPQTQKSDSQTRKIYYFQNCGTVYINVLNARGVRNNDHNPSIIGNEKGLDSQCTLPVQHAASSEITKSGPSDMNLQMNALSTPQSPRPISPSHFSGDHTPHNIKHLEQLLDSCLATVAVIQLSGNTLTDVLTPRAYDTIRALYALAALDPPVPNTKHRGDEIPTRSTSYSYSSNRSPPLPDSSLAVPRTGRIHISISMDYVKLFLWAGLAAVFCLVVFSNFPPSRLCQLRKDFKM